MNRDAIQRFMFETKVIRGELVHLDESFHTIMHQHHYPMVLRELLGETLIAAALLASTIKFDGQLTVQFQSDGPVTLLVAKCDSQGAIRGYASWREDVLPMNVAAALGAGQLVVTIEYDQKVQPYQSIIPIHHQTVSDALTDYFLQSEQLPTRIYVAVGTEHAAGLLLQVLPNEQHKLEQDQATWSEIVMLADTLTQQELLELDAQTLLHRLYHEYDLRLFDPRPLYFQCRCSLERMQGAILTLGEPAAREILLTSKAVEVKCEYCSNTYAFNHHEIDMLFDAS